MREHAPDVKASPFLAGFSLTNEIVLFEKKRLPPAFSDLP
jgi:hypothetical protein